MKNEKINKKKRQETVYQKLAELIYETKLEPSEW